MEYWPVSDGAGSRASASRVRSLRTTEVQRSLVDGTDAKYQSVREGAASSASARRVLCLLTCWYGLGNVSKLEVAKLHSSG